VRRLIRFILRKRSVSSFATEHIDPTADLSRGDATAGRRQIYDASPLVGGGIIDFRNGEVASIIAIHAPADRI
jgi:hypothetical protein